MPQCGVGTPSVTLVDHEVQLCSQLFSWHFGLIRYHAHPPRARKQLFINNLTLTSTGLLVSRDINPRSSYSHDVVFPEPSVSESERPAAAYRSEIARCMVIGWT